VPWLWGGSSIRASVVEYVSDGSPHQAAQVYAAWRGLSKLLLYTSNFSEGSLFDESVG
jgi:uncharacterized membrane protein